MKHLSTKVAVLAGVCGLVGSTLFADSSVKSNTSNHPSNEMIVTSVNPAVENKETTSETAQKEVSATESPTLHASNAAVTTEHSAHSDTAANTVHAPATKKASSTSRTPRKSASRTAKSSKTADASAQNETQAAFYQKLYTMPLTQALTPEERQTLATLVTTDDAKKLVASSSEITAKQARDMLDGK